MKILKFKKYSSDKYKIYLENGNEMILYEDIILKNNLLFTKEIDDELKDKLMSQNNYMASLTKAINYISVRMRSKREVEDYLNKHEISKKDVNKIIKKLEKDGYINDSSFAISYVNDQLLLTNYGPYKIKNNLIKLGVPTEIINDNINKINKDIVKERINKIIAKQLKIKKGSSNMLKIKLLNYINNLGYDKADILNCLSSIKVETDKTTLEKEYNKLYNKYSKKYDKEKLYYFIIQKLYSKGYTKEDIVSLKKYN